jgi:hypothetical protein
MAHKSWIVFKKKLEYTKTSQAKKTVGKNDWENGSSVGFIKFSAP